MELISLAKQQKRQVTLNEISYTNGSMDGNTNKITNFSRTCWGVLDTTLCDAVLQWLLVYLWYSGFKSSINKTDHHDAAIIVFNMALNSNKHVLLHVYTFCTLHFFCMW